MLGLQAWEAPEPRPEMDPFSPIFVNFTIFPAASLRLAFNEITICPL